MIGAITSAILVDRIKEINMSKHFWWIILLVFVLAYLTGVKYPSYGNTALSKLGV